jgi:arginyl-tRNA synthetase
VAVAALKWLDLHRDREQDVVFDLDKFLKFEGNTGIYQLYTIARLSSILDKYQFNAENSHPNISKLNDTETFLLKQTFTLPLVLEKVAQYYKPHWLCNHLFEVASEVNSWYSKYSVSQESDPERQQALLALTYKLKHHLWLGLELLGIEPLEEL